MRSATQPRRLLTRAHRSNFEIRLVPIVTATVSVPVVLVTLVFPPSPTVAIVVFVPTMVVLIAPAAAFPVTREESPPLNDAVQSRSPPRKAGESNTPHASGTDPPLDTSSPVPKESRAPEPVAEPSQADGKICSALKVATANLRDSHAAAPVSDL
jgi:hypothetical protein